jgi:dihydrodipicolinate synthase/N-acetylneuraminate lyase
MIKGSIPALVTPFKNGALDLDTLKSLVDWHIAAGLHRAGAGGHHRRKPDAVA